MFFYFCFIIAILFTILPFLGVPDRNAIIFKIAWCLQSLFFFCQKNRKTIFFLYIVLLSCHWYFIAINVLDIIDKFVKNTNLKLSCCLYCWPWIRSSLQWNELPVSNSAFLCFVFWDTFLRHLKRYALTCTILLVYRRKTNRKAKCKFEDTYLKANCQIR